MAKAEQQAATLDEVDIGDLENSVVSAVSYAGFHVTTAAGEPAMLAVIDKDGNVIDAGAAVSIAAWNVAITSYRNFLKGTGHLRVLSKPADQINRP